jgi:kynurenine formamidase
MFKQAIMLPKLMTVTICCVLAIACSSPEPDLGDALATARFLDLSHSYNSDTIYWPTEEGFVLESNFAGITGKGYYYAANSFRSAEHGGTHLDAPVHFAEGKWTTEQIPLDRLVARAVVIDVSAACAGNPDYQVGVEDLTDWESLHGTIPSGAAVLFSTGYSQYWPDRVMYMGTAERGAEAVAKLHFPGIHPEAARWLRDLRNITAIGIDTPSIDYGQSILFETHRILFEENIPAFENVAGPDRLPPTGAWVIALPMKIEGGSGGPLRIMAAVPNGL